MANLSIETISDFLSQDGEAIQSACDDEVAGVSLAQKLCPGKPYCSVRQWVLVDLDISDAQKALVLDQWTCPYKTGHQLPVKLMLLPSA